MRKPNTLMRPLSGRWWRGPARLDGDDVIVDYGRGSTYEPLSDKTIGLELTRVRTPEDATAFAKRFGLLRSGLENIDVLPGVPTHLLPPGRAPVSEFIESADRLRSIASVVRDVRHANDGDAAAMARLRARFVVAKKKPKLLQPVRYWDPTEDQIVDTDDRTVLIHASSWSGWQLSIGLKDCRSFIFDRAERGEAVPPGLLRVGILPRFLLDVCYVTMAFALADKEPVDVCPECERAFVIEDARQKFCDPKCASRARYRKFQQRKESGNGKTTRTR